MAINGTSQVLVAQAGIIGKPIRTRPHSNPVADARLEFEQAQSLRQEEARNAVQNRTGLERAIEERGVEIREAQQSELEVRDVNVARIRVEARSSNPFQPQEDASPFRQPQGTLQQGVGDATYSEGTPRNQPSRGPEDNLQRTPLAQAEEEARTPLSSGTDNGLLATRGSDRAAARQRVAEKEAEPSLTQPPARRADDTGQLRNREEIAREEQVDVSQSSQRANRLHREQQLRVAAAYNFGQFTRLNPELSLAFDGRA